MWFFKKRSSTLSTASHMQLSGKKVTKTFWTSGSIRLTVSTFLTSIGFSDYYIMNQTKRPKNGFLCKSLLIKKEYL